MGLYGRALAGMDAEDTMHASKLEQDLCLRRQTAYGHVGFVLPDTAKERDNEAESGRIDKIDPFHYYMLLLKFGMGRATTDTSQEIRTGRITREEGVALVRRYDAEFPSRFFAEFLDYTGLDEEEFHRIADSFRSEHLWASENGKWVLRHQVS